MNESLTYAPNLNQRPPRSPRVRLGGYVVLPRILDKGRAELAGTAGEFKYNNPADYHWFRFTGITPEALKAELATGKGDGEILAWIEQNAPHKRTPWEIEVRPARPRRPRHLWWQSVVARRHPVRTQLFVPAYFGSRTALRMAAKIFRIAVRLPLWAMTSGIAPPLSV